MTPWCHQLKRYSCWRLSEFLNPISWKFTELLRRHSTATNGNLVVETQEEVKGSAKYLGLILWKSQMKALRCNGNPFSIYCGKSHPVWSHKKTSRNTTEEMSKDQTNKNIRGTSTGSSESLSSQNHDWTKAYFLHKFISQIWILSITGEAFHSNEMQKGNVDWRAKRKVKGTPKDSLGTTISCCTGLTTPQLSIRKVRADYLLEILTSFGVQGPLWGVAASHQLTGRGWTN